MPETTSAAPARGPIIISRHGRPALNRDAGPKLAWNDYVDWWAKYEAGPLEDGQAPPDRLMQIVKDADVVFASSRLRAQQTAAMALPHKPAGHDPVFNEAPLPPPKLNGFKALPKTWNVLARTAWLAGHHLGDETSVGGPPARANCCAAAARGLGAGKGLSRRPWLVQPDAPAGAAPAWLGLRRRRRRPLLELPRLRVSRGIIRPAVRISVVPPPAGL